MVSARTLNADGPVIFLMGPTASGKTELAAGLTADFDIELISVDAAQVYRGMNIGTAKPNQKFLERYPHHLIDVVDPDVPYSAALFVEQARALIAAIQGRGHIPLLVGGTMFYFNALERGLSDLPAGTPEVRAEIESELATRGVSALHAELAAIDPALGMRIDSNDRQRVQRALEIHRVTGAAPSDSMGKRSGLDCVPIKLTLYHPDRSALHKRIAVRFGQMIDLGLDAEVQTLVDRFPGFASSPAGRVVGYRQTLQYLDGELDQHSWREAGAAATRQLAKRQLTWLRQQSGLVWFDASHRLTPDALRRYLDATLVDTG